MKGTLVLLSCSLLLGCSTLPKQNSASSILVENVVPSSTLVAEPASTQVTEIINAPVQDELRLSLDSLDFQKIRVAGFLRDFPRHTEQEKINYLLTSVRNSFITFVRNGSNYNSDQAARWLRWKMTHRQYRDNPILTARDFVDRVALRSERTRTPYEVVLQSGERLKLKEVLNDELETLEVGIRSQVVPVVLSNSSLGVSQQSSQKSVTSKQIIPPPQPAS